MALSKNVRNFLVIGAVAAAICGFGFFGFQSVDERLPPRGELIPFSGTILDTTYRPCAFKEVTTRSASCRNVTALRLALQDGIATVHVAQPIIAIDALRSPDMQGKRVEGLAGRSCYKVREYCIYELHVVGAPLFTYTQLERHSDIFRMIGYVLFGATCIALLVGAYFLVPIQGNDDAPTGPERLTRRLKQGAPRRLKRRAD